MVKQKEKEIYIREIKKKKKKRPYKKNKRRNEIGKQEIGKQERNCDNCEEITKSLSQKN